MNNQDLFENLSREGIQTTEEQRKNEVLNYEPKVGVFGKTGVGKSSLCNALFGQDVCEISDVGLYAQSAGGSAAYGRQENYSGGCPGCWRE